VDELIEGDGAADAMYRWTIRALYAAAISLNVWMLWNSTADEVQKAQVRDAWSRFRTQLLRPFHIEQTVQRETGPMIWEAMQIVSEEESHE
jgi:glucuronate isomerase